LFYKRIFQQSRELELFVGSGEGFQVAIREKLLSMKLQQLPDKTTLNQAKFIGSLSCGKVQSVDAQISRRLTGDLVCLINCT
jgi:hypothetical protein